MAPRLHVHVAANLASHGDESIHELNAALYTLALQATW